MKWSIDCILFWMTQYRLAGVQTGAGAPRVTLWWVEPRKVGGCPALWSKPGLVKNCIKEAEQWSMFPTVLAGSNWQDNGVRSDYEHNHHFTDTGHWPSIYTTTQDFFHQSCDSTFWRRTVRKLQSLKVFLVAVMYNPSL